jgi:ParB family transcriptional regulator, chromosome partitioning protein
MSSSVVPHEVARPGIGRPRNNGGRVEAMDGKGMLDGRQRDEKSFKLSAERIRVDAGQVRKSGKSVDDPDIVALAETIKAVGIQQPLVVRWIASDDVYEIVDGERRFVAAGLAGVRTLPVRLEDLAEDNVAWIQLLVNLHRQGLEPLDLAHALQRVMKEKKVSPVQLAEKMQKSEAWISRALSVARKLTPEAEAVARGTAQPMDMEKMYEVAQLPANAQQPVLLKIAEENLNREEVRRLVQPIKDADPGRGKSGGRPTGKKCFEWHHRVGRQLNVVVAFGRSKVEPQEVVDALSQALEVAREEAKSAA